MPERSPRQRQRIADLEKEVAELTERADRTPERLPIVTERRNPRLAITAYDPVGGTYPKRSLDPNTYWIIFVDATYTGAHGLQAITATARQTLAKTVACNIGDEYLTRGTLVEVFWDNGKWWCLRCGALRRFTLYTALVPNKVGAPAVTYNPGSTATAYLVYYNPDTSKLAVNTSFDFTVRDQQNRFRGPAYDATYWDYIIGYAKQMPDSEEWEIVTMTHKAERIKFKASAAFTTASASVAGTVEDFFNGYNPDPGGSGLTIYNWQTSDSSYQYEGDQYDLGWAWYDWTNDKYWIYDFECP